MRQHRIVGFTSFVLAVGFSTLAVPASGAVIPFSVRGVSAESAQITNLAKAQDLLDGKIQSHSDITAVFDVLNFNLSGANANGTPDFPATSPGYQTNFAEEATAWLRIPTAGAYTFAVSYDDGYRLSITGNTAQSTGQGHVKTDFLPMTFAQPGDYSVDLVYFQHLGSAQLQFFATPGTYSSFTDSGASFRLVNDVSNGGLALVSGPGAQPSAVIPEPSSLMSLGVAALGLLGRRRFA
ncbi:MAG: hypothetical protein JWO87_2227 [Phycisphaerales bacterium]|nr:hypothetical protein [Phycisphaerales bacterium]